MATAMNKEQQKINQFFRIDAFYTFFVCNFLYLLVNELDHASGSQNRSLIFLFEIITNTIWWHVNESDCRSLQNRFVFSLLFHTFSKIKLFNDQKKIEELVE